MKYSAFAFLISFCSATHALGGAPLGRSPPSPATLPTGTVDTAMPVATGNLIVVHSGDDLNAKIAGACLGDEIYIDRGATFAGPINLPNISCTHSNGGWIIIATNGVGNLPSPGSRVGPSDAPNMAKITAINGGGGSALTTSAGAHHYRIIGLELTTAPGVGTTSTLAAFIGTGSEVTKAELPRNIILDRVYAHPAVDAVSTSHGITLNGENIAVIDSYISGMHSAEYDAQAVFIWQGDGPYLIRNNYMEASGENFMSGGADATSASLIPSDISILNNWMNKPLSWYVGCPGSCPWLVKNLFELKDSIRVDIEGNRFENCWIDGQDGTAINLKTASQSGLAPWTVTHDVTFKNNIVTNAVNGLVLSSSDNEINPETPTIGAHNFDIEANYFSNIGWNPDTGNGAILFELFGGYGVALSNVTIANNTAMLNPAVSYSSSALIIFDGRPTSGFVFVHNKVTNGLYGVKGSGLAQGDATLAAFAPGGVFFGNTLIGGKQKDYSAYPGNMFTGAP